jgi:hypothetical protein
MTPNHFLKLSFACINLDSVTHIEDGLLNNAYHKTVTVHLFNGKSIRISNANDIEKLKKHLHYVNQGEEVMD